MRVSDLIEEFIKDLFDENEYIRIAIKSKEENDYLLESIKEYYL